MKKTIYSKINLPLQNLKFTKEIPSITKTNQTFKPQTKQKNKKKKQCLEQSQKWTNTPVGF